MAATKNLFSRKVGLPCFYRLWCPVWAGLSGERRAGVWGWPGGRCCGVLMCPFQGPLCGVMSLRNVVQCLEYYIDTWHRVYRKSDALSYTPRKLPRYGIVQGREG